MTFSFNHALINKKETMKSAFCLKFSMPKDGRRIQISLRLRSSREVKHLAFKYAVCSLALPCLHSLVSMRAKCKQKYVKFDCHITSTKYNSVDILDFNKTKLAKFWPYLWLPQRILQTLTNKIDCTSISRTLPPIPTQSEYVLFRLVYGLCLN